MIRQSLSTIGLDIGSNSIKGALLDIESKTLHGMTSRPFPQPISGLPAGFIEIDPKAIIAALVDIVGELSQEVGHRCSIWISGQMGGVILADHRGNPKSNYLSWRDQRSLRSTPGRKASMEVIKLDWPEPIFASLGRELQPGSLTSLMHWLSEHRQLSDGVLPLSIADYCISHLAQQPGRMHTTHAIGLLDLNSNDWHYNALERIGLGDLWLPELIRDTLSIADWKLGGRIYKVHGAYGDQQCALVGAGLKMDELSINISTGSQVSMLTERFQGGPFQTRCYFGDRWLNTITHLPAGRALNALMDLLTELATAEGKPLEHPWQSVRAKMEQIDETDLEANVAYFASAVGSSGSLSNMTTENLSVGHLFLAACKAMADNYAKAAKRLASRGTWKEVVLSGGLSSNLPKLAALIQTLFQLPIRESAGEETLLGLLRLARESIDQESQESSHYAKP